MQVYKAANMAQNWVKKSLTIIEPHKPNSSHFLVTKNPSSATPIDNKGDINRLFWLVSNKLCPLKKQGYLITGEMAMDKKIMCQLRRNLYRHKFVALFFGKKEKREP